MTSRQVSPTFLSTRTMNHVDEYTRSAVDAYVESAIGALTELQLPTLEMVVLYGSRARGDYALHSDADVALVLERTENHSSGQVLWDIGARTYSAEAQYSFLISPIVIWSQFLSTPNSSRNSFFYKNVLRDGIVWDL